MTKIGVVDGERGVEELDGNDAEGQDQVTLGPEKLAELFSLIDRDSGTLEQSAEALLRSFFPTAFFEWGVEGIPADISGTDMTPAISSINLKPDIVFFLGDKKVTLHIQNEKELAEARKQKAMAKTFCDHLVGIHNCREKIHQINSENNRSVAGLVHTLNNRITPIVMVADIARLGGKALPTDTAAMPKLQVGNCIEDFRSITSLALQMLMNEQGALKPVMKPILFSRFLEQLRDRFSEHYLRCELIEKHEAELEIDIGFFRQVMENLIINAYKYGHPQKVPLDIMIWATRDLLLIMVKDLGRGFGDSDPEKLFEFGYRSPEQSETRGHGIGLYFCRQVVNAMGGNIYAQNNSEGVGANFSMRFPLK